MKSFKDPGKEESITFGKSDFPRDWWSIPGDRLAEIMSISVKNGLNSEQVHIMQKQYGANLLPGQGTSSLTRLLWQSIRSPMMIVLLAIAGISLALGQFREAIVMAFVVAMYVGVELINKARADRTMTRLRELQSPTAIVLRDSRLREIPVGEIVVGDLLVIQTGTKIPADARLLSSSGLLINEASLTGEAAPQAKDAAAVAPRNALLGERRTAIFSGTTVLDGQGVGIVMAVGSNSELGRVAVLSSRAIPSPTPLQKEMVDLAKTLAVAAIIVSAFIPMVGWLRGYDLHQMLLTWLSLTFLMVPGQPPIIITMALALAAFELARKQVIVRRLQGAETLGSVTVVLSDKTGTMTENIMALERLILGDGTMLVKGQLVSDQMSMWQNFFFRALPAIPEITGNPTDLCVVKVAEEMQQIRDASIGRLVHQVGFATGKFYRSMEYENQIDRRLYLTGSPEYVVAHSTKEESHGQTREWDEKARDQVLEIVRQLASEGKRITAYAYRLSPVIGELPDELIFVGCVVLDDPIRPEVKNAIDQMTGAGVRTIMVTGDNAATATFVARSVGLTGTMVVTGNEIDSFSDHELVNVLKQTQVFARTTPEHKLRIVETLKRERDVVAVTGDGINDAPALHTADIGVAMGIKGTDVAKEAADLVLADDNFAHLPDALAIGRKAYDNFRKGITYYLSAKAVLLAIFVIPLLVDMPFPFAPIQIIVTELLMDLASSTIFVSEEAEPDVMQRKPRHRAKFHSWATGFLILRNMIGLVTAILVVYFASFAFGYDLTSARTAAFSTWLLGHIMLALNVKQIQKPLLKQGLLVNRFGAVWLAGMLALVLIMTLVPAMHSVLNTTFLNPVQWVLVISGSIIASSWIEVLKLLRYSSTEKSVID